MWFIGVEVVQETSAPPPKKNPRSAPVLTKFKCLLKQVLKGTAFMESSFFFNIFIIM